MLSDSEVYRLVASESDSAVSYISNSELSKNRATLLDYYNQRPYGDEEEGQSQVVTSDVSDVIEWMLPSLLRIFTQAKNVATFTSNGEDGDKEAEQKTTLANYEFLVRNKGVLLLHNMMKDALLQYTGVIKVSWDNSVRTTHKAYKGLSPLELQKLLTNDEARITQQEDNDDGTFNVEIELINKMGKVRYDVIPPEEFIINSDARDFEKPRIIGNRSPKMRFELLEMGFDPDIVNSLPSDEPFNQGEEKNSRYYNIDYGLDQTNYHPNDTVYLGEYYTYIDVDEDGISELWQVFTAGNQLLDKMRIDEHPYCVIVPIPIPHRAIGTCPAEQVADIQYWKSTLVRQMNNNIYNVNYNRFLFNERVNQDDLFNPVPGGGVRVEDQGPVDGAVREIITQPQSQVILQGIEYVDQSREIRTGMTRYSQGMDGESLNKTATGFLGIKDASQQRMELIARIFAETGIKDIFKKTIGLLSAYQDTAMQLRVSGQPLEIDPSKWRYDLDCMIDVGLGSGDRLEKIQNLNNILAVQKEMIATGSVLTDNGKLYKTLEKIITEVGLKDASNYFNNPEQPMELVLRQNEILMQQIQAMQEQMQNPLAEAEAVKANARLQEVQYKTDNEMEKFLVEEDRKRDESDQRSVEKLTELELKYNQDVPGAAV